jgi:putative FmdB family regulatory protein
VPTYQYACTEPECGHQFEAVQSFSDAALTACPVCEGRLRKVFSAVGVVFKGSGFYRTDSRAAANGKKDGESSSNGSSTAKTDAKPAAGADGSSSGSSSGSSGGSSGRPSSKGSSSAPSGGAARAAAS